MITYKVFLIIILFFLSITVTAVFYSSGSGYLLHIDSISYDDSYYLYEDKFERFNAIYDDFIVSHDYITLNTFNKLKRLFFNTVEYTERMLGGECYELSASVVSRLSYYDIPARVVVGLDVAHTWVEVYIDNEWIILDPSDDIYRYKNNQIWGVYRNYEDYKILFYL